MKNITVILAFLLVMSNSAQASDSTIDKAKEGVSQVWGKAKSTTTDIAEKTSNKASEMGSKASEIGSKVADNAKETGAVAWGKAKEAGSTTAELARRNAEKIRGLVHKEDCQEDNAVCAKK